MFAFRLDMWTAIHNPSHSLRVALWVFRSRPHGNHTPISVVLRTQQPSPTVSFRLHKAPTDSRQRLPQFPYSDVLAYYPQHPPILSMGLLTNVNMHQFL